MLLDSTGKLEFQSSWLWFTEARISGTKPADRFREITVGCETGSHTAQAGFDFPKHSRMTLNF